MLVQQIKSMIFFFFLMLWKNQIKSVKVSIQYLCLEMLVNSVSELLTWVLPALPNVESLKWGGSGDIRNSKTSLVMSNSLNASFRHSDWNQQVLILVSIWLNSKEIL